MARRFWTLMGLVSLALLAGMALTAPLPIGAPLAHYNLAFALLLLGAALAWTWLRRRRVTTITMAYTGAIATATGFVMLYSKQLPLKDWVTWWHSVTSFAFMLAFLAHWYLNNVRLVDFTRRTLRRGATALPAAGAWAGVAGGFALTWTPTGRALFHDGNYIHVSTWVVFLGVAFAWGLWLAFRAPALRARLARTRNLARALTDTSLFLACWLSLLTGFALLYFADVLRGGDLKYVSKWWHTATSVVLLALLALHVGFNARPLAAHARRLDRELRGEEKSAQAPADPREG